MISKKVATAQPGPDSYSSFISNRFCVVQIKSSCVSSAWCSCRRCCVPVHDVFCKVPSSFLLHPCRCLCRGYGEHPQQETYRLRRVLHPVHRSRNVPYICVCAFASERQVVLFRLLFLLWFELVFGNVQLALLASQ